MQYKRCFQADLANHLAFDYKVSKIVKNDSLIHELFHSEIMSNGTAKNEEKGMETDRIDW